MVFRWLFTVRREFSERFFPKETFGKFVQIEKFQLKTVSQTPSEKELKKAALEFNFRFESLEA